VPPAIEYRDVTVTAGGVTILDRISLSIDEGQAAAFLGRSGAGKTTALKTINGMVPRAAGEVLVHGAPLDRQPLPELRRRIGFVMQQPALFPHRSVFDNIATVPRLLGWPLDRIHAASETLLAPLGLAGFGPRYPRTLSGGQQQRVAIARALIAEPAILLCDEPFSALDPLIRAELLSLLRTLAAGRTLIFVTHDVGEALRIAERIVLFDAGRVVTDTTAAAFRTHNHPLVQKFVEASR
jgi:osmoprotectant transport system ATP-binding protein